MNEEQKEGDGAAAHQEHGADRRNVEGKNKGVESEPFRLDVYENASALSSDLCEAECEENEREENWDCDEKERVGDWEKAADAEKEERANSASGSGDEACARLRQSFVCLGHAMQTVGLYHDPPNM